MEPLKHIWIGFVLLNFCENLTIEIVLDTSKRFSWISTVELSRRICVSSSYNVKL